MPIQSDIANWDGKSSESIEKLYEHYHQQAAFVDKLIKLLAQPDCASGASWLLKQHMESGHVLKNTQIKRIYKALYKLQDWQSRLHILQTMPFLPIDTAEKPALKRFLDEAINDSNKFVRAWSYNGLYLLAKQYPEYQEQVKSFFDMAMHDEAASVKARIRNILKAGF